MLFKEEHGEGGKGVGEGWVDIPNLSGILLGQVSTVGNTNG